MSASIVDVTDRMRTRYSRRLGGLLALTLLVTLAFIAAFAVDAQRTGGPPTAALIGSSLIVLLNVGLFGIVVAGNVGAELRGLTEAAVAVENGDLDVRPASSRPDEVGQLAEAFAAMQDSLVEALDESERARHEAEDARQEAEELTRTLLGHADDIGTALGAAADGDFTHRLDDDVGLDAINRIVAAYEGMADELSRTINELIAFADTVGDTSTTVANEAAAIERQYDQFATDMRELAGDIIEQAERLDDATDEVTGLSAALEEIASTTNQVAARTADAAELGSAGSERADEAIDAIETIESSIESLTVLVGELDDRMDDVETTTGVIDDIAHQTDILALNASIEAARAGERGSGFGVVADEVKQLAEETQVSIDEIETTIGRARSNADGVADEMAETRTQIETSVSTIAEANETLRQLTDVVTEVDTAAAEIARSTDEGAVAAEEVTTSVETVRTVAADAAARAEDLADTAEETAATMADVRDRADTLAGRTEDLQDMLGRFDTRDLGATVSAADHGMTTRSRGDADD